MIEELCQAEARHGCLLGDFEHHATAGSKRRRELPRGHQEGEIPGNDLPHDPHRLAQGVGVESARGRERKRGAADLGRPARHIAEHVDRQGNVGDPSDGQRLAVVEGLNLGEFFQVRLQQVGDFPEHLSAFRGGQLLAPWALIEGAARSGNGAIHIFLFGFRHPRHHFAGGRIVDREGFAGCGWDEASIDQHAVLPREKLRGFGINTGINRDGCHQMPPARSAGSWVERGALPTSDAEGNNSTGTEGQSSGRAEFGLGEEKSLRHAGHACFGRCNR